MATSTPVRHAWRVLVGLLALAAVLVGINSLGVYVFQKSSWLPELALDLQGGTQIILEAQTEGGPPSAEQLSQAVTIIRQRVDASGVGEADITTQGGRNIVVQIPGTPDDQTRDRIQASAQLQLRAVLHTGAPATSFVGEDGEQTPYPTPADSLAATPSASPTNGSDLNWVTPRLQAEYLAYDCTDPANDPSRAPADQPLITCDPDNQVKYILGPVELDGSSISDASAGVEQQNNQWAVQISFDTAGTETFGKISQRLYGATAPLNQFAFVLDGSVISAPSMDGIITNGRPSISGSGITEESAKTLADQLKFGALPLSFEVVSSDTISATLGSQQLQIGLVTGLIGLALVALYSLFSYRSLGVVIIASIAVMAVLTYLVVCILAWRIGFRLSLAGVAGLIVSIGFTADSFIVYFERIRDELRDGKSITGAVEDGWGRAKRTIYISKSINVLAAVVLYILADATVKGFAFTLGLTTLIDVLIFVIFTHPVMQLLARTRFFGGGHPLSGLDPNALGSVYRGRAQFRAPTRAAGGTGKAARAARSLGEAERRQTIAERKQAELMATRSTSDTGKEGDA